MNDILDCPVEGVMVNENKARLVGAMVLILVLLFGLSHSIIFIGILVPDFLIRTSTFGQYSYLGFIADKLIPILNIKNKPTDRGPKRFAALVGFLFSDLILISFVIDQNLVAYGLSLILVIFAFLESALGFCAGCYVYTYLKRWRLISLS